MKLLFIMGSCNSIDCSRLPQDFSTYGEAKKAIHTAHFNFVDEANTSKSSWIRSASYYSCDSKTGYFEFKTDKNSYIHTDMPIEVWNGFKDAMSFGNYYNSHIKHQYQLLLKE